MRFIGRALPEHDFRAMDFFGAHSSRQSTIVPRGTFSPSQYPPTHSLGSQSNPIVPRGTIRVWESWRLTAATVAIEAEYNSLVHALESGIAKAEHSNYPALKSLGSP